MSETIRSCPRCDGDVAVLLGTQGDVLIYSCLACAGEFTALRDGDEDAPDG